MALQSLIAIYNLLLNCNTCPALAGFKPYRIEVTDFDYRLEFDFLPRLVTQQR